MIKQKPSLFKKILFIILGVFLIIISLISLIILFPSFLGLFSWDIPPIDDSDLALEKIEIPKEENAIYDLFKINELIKLPEDNEILLDHLSGRVWDNDFVKKILSENKEVLNYFSEAAKKESFQDPYLANPEEISFNQQIALMGHWRDGSKISALKALSLLKQNRTEEAINEAFNSLEVGYKIQNSQGVSIGYLVGMGIKRNGLNTLIEIISSSKLSSNKLKEVITGLEKFHKNEEGLISIFKSEYYFEKLMIKAIVEKDFDTLKYYFGDEKETKKIFKIAENNFYFQPNKTLEMLADQTRIEIKNVSRIYSQIEDSKTLRFLPDRWQDKYLFKNLFGEVIYQIYFPERDSIIKKKCEEDLLVSATQILTALKAYKIDHGFLPPSLNELTPTYISSIPIDPLNGEPIKYSPEKKIIYSVGETIDPTFKISF